MTFANDCTVDYFNGVIQIYILKSRVYDIPVDFQLLRNAIFEILLLGFPATIM